MPRRRAPPALVRSRHVVRTVAVCVVTILVVQHFYLVEHLSIQQQQRLIRYGHASSSSSTRSTSRTSSSSFHQEQVFLRQKDGALLYKEMKQAAIKFNRPAIAKVLLEHEEFDIARPPGANDVNNHTWTMADFPDLAYDDDDDQDNKNHPLNNEVNNLDDLIDSRREILDILEKANIYIKDQELLRRLPRWKDVTDLYGHEPIVVGMETCEAFRASVPAEDRFVGVGGQQNSGTNALSHFLANNLRIPQNFQVSFGMTDQLPWNKHGWLDMRGKLPQYAPYHYKIVLPVIVIRDPFFWMHSMCESPYDMEWSNHNTSSSSSSSSGSSSHNGVAPHCPNLVRPEKTDGSMLQAEADGEPVRVSWVHAFHREWQSLAHVYSEWYKEYLVDADFPRLIIRHEDLLFHAPAVLDKVRECVGAKWRHKDFAYITEPVKTSKYFTDFKAHQSGMVSAMIRYGQDKNGRRRIRNMTRADLQYARTYLDETLLMKTFGYQWPSTLSTT